MKVNHIRQNVFPVLAALIWGTAFVAQSVAADHVGPFTFTAARSAVAFVFLLVLCLVFRCLRRRDFQEEAQARPGSWRDLAIGGICCGVVLTMGTNLQQETVLRAAAVLSHIKVVADVTETACQMVASQLLHRIIPVASRGRTMQHEILHRLWRHHISPVLHSGEESPLIADHLPTNRHRKLIFSHKQKSGV